MENAVGAAAAPLTVAVVLTNVTAAAGSPQVVAEVAAHAERGAEVAALPGSAVGVVAQHEEDVAVAAHADGGVVEDLPRHDGLTGTAASCAPPGHISPGLAMNSARFAAYVPTMGDSANVVVIGKESAPTATATIMSERVSSCCKVGQLDR